MTQAELADKLPYSSPGGTAETELQNVPTTAEIVGASCKHTVRGEIAYGIGGKENGGTVGGCAGNVLVVEGDLHNVPGLDLVQHIKGGHTEKGICAGLPLGAQDSQRAAEEAVPRSGVGGNGGSGGADIMPPVPLGLPTAGFKFQEHTLGICVVDVIEAAYEVLVIIVSAAAASVGGEVQPTVYGIETLDFKEVPIIRGGQVNGLPLNIIPGVSVCQIAQVVGNDVILIAVGVVGGGSHDEVQTIVVIGHALNPVIAGAAVAGCSGGNGDAVIVQGTDIVTANGATALIDADVHIEHHGADGA